MNSQHKRSRQKLLNIFRALSASFVFSGLALSQTAEVEQAKRDYDRQQQVTNTAKFSYDNSVRETNILRSSARLASQETVRARSRFNQNEDVLRTYESKVRKYDELIQTEEAKVNEYTGRKHRLLAKREDLLTTRADKDRRAHQAHDEVTVLTRKIDRAIKNGDDAKAERLIAQKRAKVKIRDRLVAEIGVIDQNIRRNKKDIDHANAIINRANLNINDYLKQRARTQGSLNQARNQRENLRRNLQNAQYKEELETRKLEAQVRRQEELAHQYELERTRSQEMYQRYQDLLEEYEREKRQAIHVGTNTGRRDGSEEGRQAGRAAGKGRGALVARVQGERKAKQDAKSRDYAQGYRDGYKNGEDSSELSGAYHSGFQEGKSIGNSKAKAESFPKGYNDSLAKLAGSTPPNRVTVDISSSLPQLSGMSDLDLLSTTKTIGFVDPPRVTAPNQPTLTPPTSGSTQVTVPAVSYDSNNYNPPCNNFDFNLRSHCRSAYDEGYASGYKNTYTSQYRSGYAESFDLEAARIYQQTLLSYRDTTALSRGQQSGARDLGLMQGFHKIFNNSANRQYQLGSSAFEEQKTSGYLTQFVGASLEDGNRDGIFTNGENVNLNVVLDNLGLAPNPVDQLKLRVKDSKNVTKFSHTIRKLPPLEGATRTTLRGILQGFINGKYAGSDLTLEASLESRQPDGSFIEISSAHLGEKVGFPIEMISARSDRPLTQDHEVDIEFVFRNTTGTSTEPTSIKLGSVDDSLVFSNNPVVKIPALSAGATYTETLQAKAGVSPRGLSPYVIIRNKVETSARRSVQLFVSSLAVKREAAIRLFSRNGQRLTQGVRVKAGKEFKILADLEYLSSASSIGPIELKVTQKSRGISFGNNSSVNINYGRISRQSLLSKSVFKFKASSELVGQSGEVTFELTNNGKIEHSAVLKIDVK